MEHHVLHDLRGMFTIFNMPHRIDSNCVTVVLFWRDEFGDFGGITKGITNFLPFRKNMVYSVP